MKNINSSYTTTLLLAIVLGASLGLVAVGGVVIVGGTYGVYQAQEAIYDELGID